MALTPAVLAALDDVARAEDRYHPGLDSASRLEIPKLALADAVLLEARRQRLPGRAGAPARASIQSSRRRRA